MIPLMNVKEQFASIQSEILKAMKEVTESGSYILGPKVDELEKNIAQKLGVSSAVAVGNGTDALILTLEAYGIGKGDEVITSPFTFFASGEAISRVGAIPVFADVNPDTYTLCPDKIKAKLTKRTKAIIPVHLFGQCADMLAINELANKHNLLVIEDACQAFGAKQGGKPAGSLGDAGCFSFFPTKNLGTLGDGGIITTSDPLLAEKLRSLRVHGSNKKYFHQEIGYNSRLDELHAAVLLICLKNIDNWNLKRTKIAEIYDLMLKTIPSIKAPHAAQNNHHVYHLYCIQSNKRDLIAKLLQQNAIQSGIYYPCCLHLQQAYTHLGHQKGDFPVAERLSETLLAIPLHPFMLKEDHLKIVNVFLNNKEVFSC
ncbi:DegT/DnrJ/EryC1/StrS family aminotransferase [Jeotgalibacillus campisalis]|uniref:Glutamine--scyllo-inositol aminotransferase n=1 Tax=Jeotgalibacillus campisalis TaxID=220754 RepID=A0A0C2RZ42_9BACL|nr:DegT/DnrJ/EryC1/StrS family aminotransferase [Jeotgalibacillus campisalis]KIL47049.1 glutamine--scyllo-inositol aminotransferase [Jeotgalibacillus campisalis]